MKNREKTIQIVLVGVFAAVLAVLSQISIPLPSGIPVTLQTFAVALCGYALGWKRGLLATAVSWENRSNTSLRMALPTMPPLPRRPRSFWKTTR